MWTRTFSKLHLLQTHIALEVATKWCSRADVLSVEFTCCTRLPCQTALLAWGKSSQPCTTPHNNISKRIHQLQNYTKIRWRFVESYGLIDLTLKVASRSIYMDWNHASLDYQRVTAVFTVYTLISPVGWMPAKHIIQHKQLSSHVTWTYFSEGKMYCIMI